MTKLEIIEETTSFYNSHNRAVFIRDNRSDACVYEASNGNKCAVGRCLIDTSNLVDRVAISVATLIKISDVDSLDSLLKEQYRGHSETFWSSLQDFHDFEGNFTTDGLSPRGLFQKDLLISLYKNK